MPIAVPDKPAFNNLDHMGATVPFPDQPRAALELDLRDDAHLITTSKPIRDLL